MEVGNNLFVGTYTKKEAHVDGKADGIYVVEASKENGMMKFKKMSAKLVNPSYVVTSKEGKYLFAVSEVCEKNNGEGHIHSYEISKEDGSLKPINSIPIEDFSCCHITLGPNENFLFVSSYLGGTISMFKIEKDGSLSFSCKFKLSGNGPRKDRQTCSHVHSSAISNDNTTLFVADLGSDKVWIFTIDYINGKFFPNSKQEFLTCRPGSGPRHLCIKFNEDEKTLKEISFYSTLPSDFKGISHSADLHIHPNKKFIYGSNRGHDSIVIFEIITKEKRLKLVGYEETKGIFPRGFSICPDGKRMYVANQNSDNIVFFSIDEETGKLSYGGEISIKTPVCLAWGK